MIFATEGFFYFKAPFDVVTIRGWLDFEGGIHRDRHAHTYTASIISYLYARIIRVCISIAVNPLLHGEILKAAFLTETCGDVLRVAGFRGMVRFRGNTALLSYRSTVKKVILYSSLV